MSELVERRKALSTDRFRATSVKIMQDGVAENFTASMTEPYCDGHGHRRDARHHIAHLRVIHPDDIHRFRELGVIANLQAFWAALEAQMVELTLPFLGEPRASWQYPFGDLHRSGAALAMGSDWAISTAARWRSTPCSSRAASRPRERPHRLHRRVGLREPAR